MDILGGRYCETKKYCFKAIIAWICAIGIFIISVIGLEFIAAYLYSDAGTSLFSFLALVLIYVLFYLIAYLVFSAIITNHKDLSDKKVLKNKEAVLFVILLAQIFFIITAIIDGNFFGLISDIAVIFFCIIAFGIEVLKAQKAKPLIEK